MKNTDTHPFGYWITAVDRLMRAEFATVFSDEGITRRDWRMLNRIDGTHGDRPHHGRRGFALRRLSELGWIERTADGWGLTDAGALAKQRLGTSVDEIRARVSGVLTPDEYATMTASLEKIAREFGWEEGKPLPRLHEGRGDGRGHGGGHGHGHGGRGHRGRGFGHSSEGGGHGGDGHGGRGHRRGFGHWPEDGGHDGDRHDGHGHAGDGHPYARGHHGHPLGARGDRGRGNHLHGGHGCSSRGRGDGGHDRHGHGGDHGSYGRGHHEHPLGARGDRRRGHRGHDGAHDPGTHEQHRVHGCGHHRHGAPRHHRGDRPTPEHHVHIHHHH